MESNSSQFAIQELVDQAPWVRALALHLVQDEAEAEDLAQETLTAALIRRPSTGHDLRGWLYRVLRNQRAWLARGRAARLSREEQASQAEALPSPEELLERAETQRRLVDQVLGLEEPYRTLLLLRFFEGLSPAEIASKQGRPAGSVRGQISRGLEILRSRLDATDPESRLEWRLAVLPFLRKLPTAPGAVGLGTAATPLLPLLSMTLLAKASAAILTIVAALIILGPTNDPSPPSDLPVQQDVGANEERASHSALSTASAEASNESLQPASARSSVLTGAEGSAIAGAFLHGTLLNGGGGPDGISSPPLNDFLIEVVRDGLLVERVVTDENGEFQCRKAQKPGDYELRLLDHEELDRDRWAAGEIVKQGSIEAQEIAWEPGIDLVVIANPRLQFPLTLAGLSAAEQRLKRIDLLDMPARNINVGGLVPQRYSAPLRSGPGGSWVRFHDNGYSGLPHWYVTAETEDGLWFGETRLDPVGGRHALPVRIELEQAARLQVRIPYPADYDISSLVCLLTPPKDQNFSRISLPLESLENGVATFAKGAIFPGEYNLVAYGDGTDVSRDVVRLKGGVQDVAYLEFEFPDKLYPLLITYTSQTGEFHDLLSMGLVSVNTEDEKTYRGGTSNWSQDEAGTWTGTQDLGMVPPGDYRLFMQISLAFKPWDTRGRSISIPGDPVEILIQDAGPSRSMALRIRDAKSGETIPLVHLEVFLNDEIGPLCIQRNGVYHMPNIPESCASRWSASKAGYQSKQGDWSAALLEDGFWILDVVLEPTD